VQGAEGWIDGGGAQAGAGDARYVGDRAEDGAAGIVRGGGVAARRQPEIEGKNAQEGQGSERECSCCTACVCRCEAGPPRPLQLTAAASPCAARPAATYATSDAPVGGGGWAADGGGQSKGTHKPEGGLSGGAVDGSGRQLPQVAIFPAEKDARIFQMVRHRIFKKVKRYVLNPQSPEANPKA
jgi:hypothetical protein